MLTALLVPALAGSMVAAGESNTLIKPEIIETRTVRVTQTVTLHDVPADARHVQLWVPVPTDGPWQRVLDRKVESAQGTWSLQRLAEGRGELVYVELDNPGPGPHEVVVSAIVETQGVAFPLKAVPNVPRVFQPRLFAEHLAHDAPLMEVDGQIKAIADRACGTTTDPAQKAMLLLKAVADMADHYSKSPNVPTCGRGAASDCLEHGGGCCTDLHSLFIALARAKDIPARLQFGYRVLDGREGSTYDPGYRCWVEFFIPGAGWVPTDIVAADGTDDSVGHRWASLSSTRIWLWEGRSFELTPPAKAGRVHTMLAGWAEIDGKAVDVLPADDGTPSDLRRVVHFEVLDNTRTAATATLPQ